MTGEEMQALDAVLHELYTPEGVRAWWDAWRRADADRRDHMVRVAVAAADGAFA